MKNDSKTAKKGNGKLVINKEMLRNLNVRTSVQTGMRAVGGCPCPSWPDASCASGMCVMR